MTKHCALRIHPVFDIEEDGFILWTAQVDKDTSQIPSPAHCHNIRRMSSHDSVHKLERISAMTGPSLLLADFGVAFQIQPPGN